MPGKIRSRIAADNAQLVEIWLRSVRASHDFLGEQDILDLYPQVRDVYLPQVEVWVYETAEARPGGFIGLNEAHVEMLFIDPALRGQGIGSRLLDHVRGLQPLLTVDVNEQNPQACGFYQRYGFHPTGRSATDSAGRPFPLIHMALRP